MAHTHEDNHDHGHPEAQQNEITGPVLFALVCAVIAVLIIYFWAS